MKEYYFYKQKGFNANKREEIQVNLTPFEVLTRYQPKDYNLPYVSNEQVETYKSVSYTEIHPRFRLIVDTNKEMNE